jgi:hypothetical protein
MRIFGRTKNPRSSSPLSPTIGGPIGGVAVPSTTVRAIAPNVQPFGYADPGVCYEDDDCAWPNVCIDNVCQPASTGTAQGWIPDTIKLPQICGTKVCPPGWTCVTEQSGANACIYSPPNAPVGPSYGGLAPLSAAQVAYLRDRALRFQQTVGDALGLPFGAYVKTAEGREVIAELAATAVFGDDMNYATGLPSPEWQGEGRWAQAYYLVRDSLPAWMSDAGLP